MVFVEAARCIVLGIDNQREDSRVGSHCAGYRVHNERGTQTAAAERLIDREPADQASRKG